MSAKKSPAGNSCWRRYEIRVRGPLGPTIAEAFPTLAVNRSGPDTLLSGALPDQSALYGVIHQLEAFGLQLLEVSCAKSGVTEPAWECSAAGAPRSINTDWSPHMSNIDSLLTRNAAFAASDARYNAPRLPFLPHQGLYVITCIDPRVDPADFLGLELGDAIVARTVGGRVTPAVIQDVAYIGYLVETKAPDGPYFEAAIIHHTDCGSGLLADDDLRHGFSERTGYDDETLAELPVLDPPATVRADVERLLSDPRISPRITVSGHVYDVHTGLVRTIVQPASPTASSTGLPEALAAKASV